MLEEDDGALQDATEKRCCCNAFNIKAGAYSVALVYCLIIVSNLGIRFYRFAELLFLFSDSIAVACLIYGLYRNHPAFLQPFTVVSIVTINFSILLTVYYAYAMFKPSSYFGEQIEIQFAGNVQKIAETINVDQKFMLVVVAVLGTLTYAGTVFVHAWFMVIVVHCAQEFRRLQSKPILTESLMLEDKESSAERSGSPADTEDTMEKVISYL